MTDILPDGVYVDLPEADYFAQPRVGSSDLAALLKSPGTFWANSWMNTNKKPQDETKYQIAGRAWHMARLEPERFAETYCREFTPEVFAEMFPDGLRSDMDVQEALAEIGEPKTKKGETVAARAARLAELGFPQALYHVERATYDEANDNRTPLPSEIFDDIERHARIVNAMPEIASRLHGSGMSEVSVLWTDAATAVPCRARFDRIIPEAGEWIDLKTFETRGSKDVFRHAHDAFRFNAYYLQAAHYDDAMRAIRAGRVRSRSAAGDGLVAAIREAERMQPVYVFMEKGGSPTIFALKVPLTYGDEEGEEGEEGDPIVMGEIKLADGERKASRDEPLPSPIIHKGRKDRSVALQSFKVHCDVFPNEPWLVIDPVRNLDESLFNHFWLEE